MSLLLNSVLLIPLVMTIISKSRIRVFSVYIACLIPAQVYPSVLCLLIILIMFNLRFKTVLIKKYGSIQWLFFIWLLSALYNLPYAVDYMRFVTEFASLLVGLLLMYNLLEELDSLREISILFKGFLYGSILVAVYHLWLFSIGADMSQESTTLFSISGTFNYTSLYILLGLIVGPVFVFNFSKIVRISSCCIGFVLLLLLESRGAMIVGAMVLVYRFLFQVRVHVLVKLIGIILMGIIGFKYYESVNPARAMLFSVTNFEDNTSNIERLELILRSLELFQSSMIGYGIGSTSILFGDFLSSFGNIHPHPHNTISMLLIEAGIMGIILILTLLYFCLRLTIALRSIVRKRSKNLEAKTRYFLTVSLILILASYFVLDSLFFNGVTSIITFVILSIIFCNYKIIDFRNA